MKKLSQSLNSNGLIASSLAAAIAPFAIAVPVFAASFTDIGGHWAKTFIERLADANVIAGFPDGTFKPEQPVTRAQFAAIVRQAYNQDAVRQYRGFSDVPTNFWATPAITKAVETGFVSGYPGGLFKPNQEIPKVQVLVSLASGLRLSPKGSADKVLGVYQDAAEIPGYATDGVAAVTEKSIVINYPNVKFLNPNETATRADVAAYIYQSLVNQGQFKAVSKQDPAAAYLVAGSSTTTTTPPQPKPPVTQPPKVAANTTVITKGTRIRLQYPDKPDAEIIMVSGETVEMTLTVPTRVVNADGQTIVPAGARLQGKFVPVQVDGVAGTRFVAEKLLLTGTYSLSAISSVKQATSSQSLQTSVIQGAVVTPAAQNIVQAKTGSTSLGNLALDVVQSVITPSTNRSTSASVVVFSPADLTVTVQTPLKLNTTFSNTSQ
jgi:S-layer homology domain